ncbi:hypothetical protein PILCRDRAFT_8632 [Piloderma croceum F 1598]|uniref:Uncharacterized protein n=1 Tax=Piloderma croceum (strain F 1598) TaxID=765440 RepID=A0A0C3FR34_PILCF|nr:hypothetical protein PILCRDRAFT_8632 [Piloderma croceum F 1598]
MRPLLDIHDTPEDVKRTCAAAAKPAKCTPVYEPDYDGMETVSDTRIFPIVPTMATDPKALSVTLKTGSITLRILVNGPRSRNGKP